MYAVSEHVEERQSSSRDYDTSVRALSFEGDWRKVEGSRLRIVSAGVYQGLDYLGARSDADYDMDFLRFRLSGLQVTRCQRVGRVWCLARCTGVMTGCSIANGWGLVGRASGVAIPVISPTETRVGVWLTR